jgi:hypothetical protein
MSTPTAQNTTALEDRRTHTVTDSAQLDKLITASAAAREGQLAPADVEALLIQLTEAVEEYAGTVRAAERAASLVVDNGADADTIQGGLDGPFNYWDHDHTGLVHVLSSAKHSGLTLKEDADEIASRIRGSRWFAANSARVLETGESTVRPR